MRNRLKEVPAAEEVPSEEVTFAWEDVVLTAEVNGKKVELNLQDIREILITPDVFTRLTRDMTNLCELLGKIYNGPDTVALVSFSAHFPCGKLSEILDKIRRKLQEKIKEKE